MSSLDLLREFAESREHDAVLVRDGVSYGEIRDALRVIAELEAELAVERERRKSAEKALQDLVGEQDRIFNIERLYGKPNIPNRQWLIEAWKAARNHFARYKKEPTC